MFVKKNEKRRTALFEPLETLVVPRNFFCFFACFLGAVFLHLLWNLILSYFYTFLLLTFQ